MRRHITLSRRRRKQRTAPSPGLGAAAVVLLVGAVLVLALAGCGGDIPTVPPIPTPPPTTAPTPPPAPTWPQIAFPVRASGAQFVDSTGRRVRRWGAWWLYGSGWTAPTIRALSRPGVVARLTDAGVNWIGARPGPQSSDGPDGNPCLAILEPLRTTIETAYAHGAVVEVALFDIWIIQHGYSCDPSWRYADFQGGALTASQAEWLRQLSTVVAGAPNVVLQDANEAFKARPSVAWWRSLRAYQRALFPGMLLGTNSNNPDIEALADYVLVHGDTPSRIRAGRPTGVNESGPDLSCQDWERASAAAERAGTFFDLWSGDMDEAAFEQCLVRHAAIRRASGT